MTVAWIGNRGALVQQAVEHAAELLAASRCPVISIDADIEGTRAAIALARRIGAAYDHPDQGGLARETAAFVDVGGMFVTPGEVRRRADLVVIVGDLPPGAQDFVAGLAQTAPDLAETNARGFFLIADKPGQVFPPDMNVPVTSLSCEGTDLGGTVAALRAQYAGRRVEKPVGNFDRLAEAIGRARFTAFLCSGFGSHHLVLEMMQGLVADLNRNARASILVLPSSDAGWGSTLVSTWTTGFPLRTSFSRGFAEFDPWRWNVGRMIEEGEADLHLWITTTPGRKPVQRKDVALIALTKTGKPVAHAAVTISIGEPGADHDAVIFSSRTGTTTARKALASTELPSAGSILKAIAEHLPAEEGMPC